MKEKTKNKIKAKKSFKYRIIWYGIFEHQKVKSRMFTAFLIFHNSKFKNKKQTYILSDTL